MSTIGWKSETVADCLDNRAVPTGARLLTKDYQLHGKYPIVDQGQKLIAGWTDDDSALVRKSLPVVVFGDHTRMFKFIDFPFVRGADGTQILKPKASIDPRFFYYACRAINLPSRGYNRHFSLLRERMIPLPSPGEQANIAACLHSVEQAAQQQPKLLDAFDGLKRAVMRELFTCGLGREAQKETDFGYAPQSWELLPVSALTSRSQYGLSIRGQPVGAYPILRMNCQDDGRVVLRDLQYVDVDDRTFSAFRLRAGDILFNRTNSFELVGRSALVDADLDAVFASYLVRVTVDRKRAVPAYLNYFFNWPTTQIELKKLASRGVSQANINATKLSGLVIPLPSVGEQREIASILDAIDRKIDLHKRKQAVLEELFKTLLHQLMTAAIRVTDLDPSALTAHETNAETALPLPPTAPDELFGSLRRQGEPKCLEEMQQGVAAEVQRRHAQGRY